MQSSRRASRRRTRGPSPGEAPWMPALLQARARRRGEPLGEAVRQSVPPPSVGTAAAGRRERGHSAVGDPGRRLLRASPTSIEFEDKPASHRRPRPASSARTGKATVRVFCDKKSILYLGGSVLDWEKTLMFQGLQVQEPAGGHPLRLRPQLHRRHGGAAAHPGGGPSARRRKRASPGAEQPRRRGARRARPRRRARSRCS